MYTYYQKCKSHNILHHIKSYITFWSIFPQEIVSSPGYQWGSFLLYDKVSTAVFYIILKRLSAAPFHFLYSFYIRRCGSYVCKVASVLCGHSVGARFESSPQQIDALDIYERVFRIWLKIVSAMLTKHVKVIINMSRVLHPLQWNGH